MPSKSPASTKTNLSQHTKQEGWGNGKPGDSNFAAVEMEQPGTIFNSVKVYYLVLCRNKNSDQLMPVH